MAAHPKDEYARRRVQAEADLVRLDRQGAWLANLRGLLFFGSALLVVLIVFDKAPRGAWAMVGAAAALYTVIAVIHARVLEREQRARLSRDVNVRALGRLDGSWRRHPRRGDGLARRALTSSDLDVFGPASLFQLVTEAVTQDGERRLAALLEDGADDPAGAQGAVQDLAPRLGFRQAFSVSTQVASGLGADGTGLVRWAESPDPLATIRWTRWTPYVLPALTFVLFSLSREGAVPRWAYLPPLLLQLGVAAWTERVFGRIYTLLARGEHGMVRWASAFRQIEGEAFQAPLLVTLTAGFRPAAGDQPVSQRLTRLGRLFSAVEVRQSGLVGGLLRFALLWDVLFFFRLEAWRARHGAAVRGWVAALAELEALASLAAWAHAHPELPYPTVDASGPRFSARGLAHPLLDAPVANDVTLASPGEALIITGSNMSGKTTLLRAMGANALLARAGAPVRATALQLAPLAVVTSMRVKDSLERGVSYFYAEVERLKAVLDAARAADGKLLFLLDEVLLGTNTRERQIASREVLKMLLGTGAIGGVTTHDLALTTLANAPEARVQNVHFQDVLVDGTLRFDYRLRPGVVETSNALRVLRQAGIPVADAEA